MEPDFVRAIGFSRNAVDYRINGLVIARVGCRKSFRCLVKAPGLEPGTYGLKDLPADDASLSTAITSDTSPPWVAHGLLEPFSRDSDLLQLVEAWPKLPEHVRRTILALADGCK
jgi:hypothetical protein